jgi:hypothetical protein
MRNIFYLSYSLFPSKFRDKVSRGVAFTWGIRIVQSVMYEYIYVIALKI